LINDAMPAAPNPLSILTTETLGARAFNVPGSAATPVKEACAAPKTSSLEAASPEAFSS
jgi:hypothetical protein